MAVFSRLTAPGIRLFRQGFKNVNQQVPSFFLADCLLSGTHAPVSYHLCSFIKPL